MLRLLVLMALTILLASCGQGEGSFNLEIPNVRGPKLELTKKNLKLSMVFEQISSSGGLRYTIPHFKNSSVQTAPDLHSSGSEITFNISLKDLLSNPLAKVAPQILPGGHKIPKSDALPGVIFSIEHFGIIAIYQDRNEFIVWLPLKGMKFKENVISASYYNNNRKVGEMSLIGRGKNGDNGGILLRLDSKLSP